MSRNARNAQAWTDAQREAALQRAGEVGAAAAGKELGISPGTIRSWRSRSGRVAQVPSGADPADWAQAKRDGAQDTWKAAQQALSKVRELLNADRMGDAQRAAITMAVLIDKSGIMELAAERADEAQARLTEEHGRQIVAVLENVVKDLALPVSPAVRRLLSARLRGATDGEAIEDARREIREHFAAQVERERPALPAGEPDPDDGELVTGTVEEPPARSDGPSEAESRARRRPRKPAPAPQPDPAPLPAPIGDGSMFGDVIQAIHTPGEPLFADPSAGDSWTPGTMPTARQRASRQRVRR